MTRADRIRYSQESIDWFMDHVEGQRNIVWVKPGMFAGRRFNDNDYVLTVLESQTKESDFRHYPLLAIGKALEESARADYWYKYEKDYGTDDVTDCREEGCLHEYDGK